MTNDNQQKKATLQEEKNKVLQQIAVLKKNDPMMDPDHANDNAAVDTDIREQGGHQVIEAEVAALQDRIKDIDASLAKLDSGRYGYCSKCGKQIPAARLELIPEAQYCVECENKMTG
jgi:DnaK suppressor protein